MATRSVALEADTPPHLAHEADTLSHLALEALYAALADLSGDRPRRLGLCRMLPGPLKLQRLDLLHPQAQVR